MKTLLKLAARNVARSSRRSLMTISAISIGAASLLVFGQFINFMVLGLQTNAVRHAGHLALFRSGYFQYGAGSPANYGIHDYEGVISLLEGDPVLKPLLRVVTPTVNLFGIAGNFDANTSKTFYGVGMVPSDFQKMWGWDEYEMGHQVTGPADFGLDDQDQSRGIIGVGMARILGLCTPLKIADCPPRPLLQPESKTAASSATIRDFTELTAQDTPAPSAPTAAPSAENNSKNALPRLDLLAGTAAGAPNVVSLYVSKAVPQGIKELDDSFVGMNFKLAQELLYGRGEHQAVSIVVQLQRTEDMALARSRVENLVKSKNLDLEVKDLLDLQPFYRQVIAMFGSIFGFISAIMGIIVLFTVINTMSMSVMERTQEIGTLRALGVKKNGIRAQFLVEGAILGVLGASLGLILGSIAGYVVNHSGLKWLPPGQAALVPMEVLTARSGWLAVGIWIGLILMATLASLIPANRAAKMKVVDALGHV